MSSLYERAMDWGVRFVEDVHCATWTQVRFPRSRTRRIRKKWAQRERNWRMIPWPDLYQLPNGVLVGHPQTIARIKHVIRQEGAT